jgi:hypothetical protein
MTKLTNEEAIERIVERSMTILDKQLLTNQLSQDAYDEEVKALDEWAREMYANHIDEVL